MAPLQSAAASQGDEPKQSLRVVLTESCVSLMLPAKELPQASGLLLGLGRGWQRSAIVWLPLRNAGQVQVLRAFTLRLSWKQHPEHQLDSLTPAGQAAES